MTDRRMGPMIAGGGPAGATTAILLARAGIVPRLFERSTGPQDVVCGAFLGWDALANLDALGIDRATLGGHAIGRVRIVAGGRQVEADLPQMSAGLSRRRLDALLLARAGDAGAAIERGVTIRAADGETGPKRLRLGDGREVRGDALFLATGKHELRGLARPRAATPSVGFRTVLAPTPALARALAGTIELHAFDGGYAGLLLQEDGTANLCLSADARRIGPGGIAALLAELRHEAPMLADRAALAAGWSAISGVPYGWRARTSVAGVFRLGDQGAVIASLAGDGVAIAIASARSAAAAYLRHGPAGAARWQAGFARRARRPLAAASGVRHLAEHGGWRGPMLAMLRAWPGLAGIAARATRIGH